MYFLFFLVNVLARFVSKATVLWKPHHEDYVFVFVKGGAAEIIEIDGSRMQRNILSQIILGTLQQCLKPCEKLKETYNRT